MKTFNIVQGGKENINWRCVTMIAEQAIEQSKENFSDIHLELEKQLVVHSPLDEGVVKKREWNVKPSTFSLNTTNPIRAIVEHLNVQPNPDKSFIPLSVGKCLNHILVDSFFKVHKGNF